MVLPEAAEREYKAVDHQSYRNIPEVPIITPVGADCDVNGEAKDIGYSSTLLHNSLNSERSGYFTDENSDDGQSSPHCCDSRKEVGTLASNNNESYEHQNVKSLRLFRNVLVRRTQGPTDPIRILNLLGDLGSNAVLFLTDTIEEIRRMSDIGALQQLIITSNLDVESSTTIESSALTTLFHLDQYLQKLAVEDRNIDRSDYIPSGSIERDDNCQETFSKNRIAESWEFPKILKKSSVSKVRSCGSTLFFWM